MRNPSHAKACWYSSYSILTAISAAVELDNHSRKRGLQYTYREVGFDSTGLRIVRGYGYRFVSTGDRRERGNIRRLTLLLRTCNAWHLQGVGAGRSCRCRR
jgi:hypothetical protein